jgi:hypothetical protein
VDGVEDSVRAAMRSSTAFSHVSINGSYNFVVEFDSCRAGELDVEYALAHHFTI